MHSQLALTEHASLNLAPLILLDPVVHLEKENCLCGSAHIIPSLVLVRPKRDSRHRITYSQASRSDKSHRFGRAGPGQLRRQIRPTGEASKLMRGTFLSLSSTYKFWVPLSDEVGQSSGKQHAASAGAPQCPLLQSRLVEN